MRRLKDLGGKAVGHAADVRDATAVGGVLTAVHDAFGDIDVLVSGAAGNFPAPALGMSPNAFKAVVDIDLLGHLQRGARRRTSTSKKPGAVIINISAPQSVHARRCQSHVCAAKAGVDMLTRVLAIEWGGDGIRVNSIIPGPIADTEGMARLAPNPKIHTALEQALPLRRFGTKAEVADLALFLASPMAAYITGAIVPVDGGLTASGPRGLAHAALQDPLAAEQAQHGADHVGVVVGPYPLARVWVERLPVLVAR